LEYADEPLEEVKSRRAEGPEGLLNIRAWEIAESPADLGYRYVEGWLKLPEGWELGQVAGVAADSKGRYYLYHRGSEAPPIICLDREGEVLSQWGEGVYGRPHMVKCDEDDNVWAVDDGSNILYLYSPRGEVLRTLGVRDVHRHRLRHRWRVLRLRRVREQKNGQIRRGPQFPGAMGLGR